MLEDVQQAFSKGVHRVALAVAGFLPGVLTMLLVLAFAIGTAYLAAAAPPRRRRPHRLLFRPLWRYRAGARVAIGLGSREAVNRDWHRREHEGARGEAAEEADEIHHM